MDNVNTEPRRSSRPCSKCRVDGIHASLREQFDNLKDAGPLKFGRLLRCDKCGARWFDLPNSFGPSRIHDEDWPLVQAWQEQTLGLSERFIELLKPIGGVQNYDRNTISLPVEVTLKDGRCFERALVWITQRPPSRRHKPAPIVWSEEIARLEGAHSALPCAVRRALEEKAEEAMGFTPVGIATADERRWTLPCAGSFLDHEGVLGPEVRLAERKKRGFWRRETLVRPAPPDVYLWCDWFEGCRTFLK